MEYIAINALASGVYWVRLVDEEGKTSIQKFIKN